MDELGTARRARLSEQFGRSYKAGDRIFQESEPAEACFLLQSGRVRLLKLIRNAERSLTVLRPGDLFGEDALIPGAKRSATAVALSDVQVLALDRSTFGALLAESEDVSTRLVAYLVQRIRHAEEQLENAMIKDHPSRIVNTLLRLAPPDANDSVALELSPLELASRVGLDVDTVKRSVQQLRDGGYLKIKEERIVLPDVEALRRLYHLLGMKEEVRGGYP